MWETVWNMCTINGNNAATYKKLFKGVKKDKKECLACN